MFTVNIVEIFEDFNDSITIKEVNQAVQLSELFFSPFSKLLQYLELDLVKIFFDYFLLFHQIFFAVFLWEMGARAESYRTKTKRF